MCRIGIYRHIIILKLKRDERKKMIRHFRNVMSVSKISGDRNRWTATTTTKNKCSITTKPLSFALFLLSTNVCIDNVSRVRCAPAWVTFGLCPMNLMTSESYLIHFNTHCHSALMRRSRIYLQWSARALFLNGIRVPKSIWVEHFLKKLILARRCICACGLNTIFGKLNKVHSTDACLAMRWICGRLLVLISINIVSTTQKQRVQIDIFGGK